MKIQILLSAIVLASSVAHSSTSCVESHEPAARAVATSARLFSTDFFKTVRKHHKGNLVSSPYGAYAVLSMISMGARGSTEELLKSFLNQPCDKSLFNRGFQELTDNFNQSSGVKLMIGNKIFVFCEHNLQESFRESTKTVFRSESQSLDFDIAEEAANAVNNWCASATQNHITELFKPEDLAQSKLVLVNAIYFKGKWETEFDRDVQRFESFYIDEKTEKQVEMMHVSGTFYTGELSDVNARFVILPYHSDNSESQYCMTIIVPAQVNGIQKLVDNLPNYDLSKLPGQNLSLDVFLPKFKFPSEIDLKPILQEMNMTEIFESSANFGGILEDDTKISISKMLQKTIIEVNEEGSEAAAATGEADLHSMHILDFNANRPFFFAIIEQKTGTQIFSGVVSDPTVSA